MSSVVKKTLLALIRGYQYLSRMLPGSCRYYPTCSQYATWQIDTTDAPHALAASTLRILRCNQLFAGGIDFPVIRFTPPPKTAAANPCHPAATLTHPLPQPNPGDSKITLKYWIVPGGKRDRYFVVKDLNGTSIG